MIKPNDSATANDMGNDEASTSRRGLALAVLGALGGASLLEACADASQSSETLGQVRSALNGTTNIYWVDTTANLASLPGGANYVAILEGYWASGDGGGGTFVWSTTPATDDRGTIFNPAGLGSYAAGWRRIYDGHLNVKWFGAKGDGATNDAPALQLALDAISNVGTPPVPLTKGNTLFFPKGTYMITSQLLLSGANGSRLVGAGRFQTTIQWNTSSSSGSAMLKMRWCSHCSVENIAFEASNPLAIGFCGRGIYLTSDGFTSTVNTNSTDYNSISNCAVAHASTVGIQLGNDSNIDVNLEGNTVANCHVSHCGVGIRIFNKTQAQTTIYDGSVGYCTTAGIEVGQFVHAVRISNIDLAQNGTAHVLVRKEFDGFLYFGDAYLEMGDPNGTNHPIILAEVESAGVANYGTIEIHNVRATIAGSTSFRIIDCQHNGTLVLKNCTFNGPGGSVTNDVFFSPLAQAGEGGSHLLLTENVWLFAGAQYNVRTTGNGPVRWIDTGSAKVSTITSPVPNPDVILTNARLLIGAGSGLQFASNVAIPMINQVAGSGDGGTMRFRGQDGGGANSAGGTTIIGSGVRTGTGLRGSAQIGINGGGETMVETVEIASNRRVVALCGGQPLANTYSLGNTGDRVIFITNAGVAPTANYTSGGILYVESGALKYRGANGTVTTLANA